MNGYLIFGLFVFIGFDLVSADWDADKPKMMKHVSELNRKYRGLEKNQKEQQIMIDDNTNELVKKQKVIDDLVEKDNMKTEKIRALEKENLLLNLQGMMCKIRVQSQGNMYS